MDKPQAHSLDQALAKLLEQAFTVQTSELVPLDKAVGRVLAAGVVSAIDVPPANNSQMDGYAVRASDCAAIGAILTVTQRIPAGKPSAEPLLAGQAARIFTGAFMPAGADAVVMQELCSLEGAQITVNEAVKRQQWVRQQGSDVAQGATVLKAGTRITPLGLGLLASVGLAEVSVFKPLTVGLMCTGDELTPPGQPLPLGNIYNSNRPMLRALLQGLGCVVIDSGDVPDTLPATTAALADLAARCDVVVSTGGVSVGEEDHVKAAVQALGRLDLWSLAIKPGKPFAFGFLNASGTDKPFLGLPGNPVSALVTYWLLVRPFVLRSMGAAATGLPQAIPVKAAFTWHADRRREFLRVRLNSVGEAELFGNQNSGVLTSAVWGDGLVDVAIGQQVAEGDTVSYIPFSALQ